MFDISIISVLVPLAYYSLTPFAPQSSRASLIIVVGTLIFLITFWEYYVSHVVPEPYLDEVFHIPQAQAYCNGKFNVWDPKLTTPPGLYIFAIFKILALQIVTGTSCNIHALRSFNSIVLFVSFLCAFHCRLQITCSYRDALHTAFNVAIFPPLFFYSGLFYTDNLSLCVVLTSYWLVLNRTKAKRDYRSSLWVLIVGIVAVTIRQTNIFWVAVFAGTQELTDKLLSGNPRDYVPRIWPEKIQQYFNGVAHGILLIDATPQDFFLFPLSLLIIGSNQPLSLLRSIWPYVALFVLFGGFVLWNRGVVLGDKLNHVATIHLPQMLYIWPFITFFSAPLILLTLLKSFNVERLSLNAFRLSVLRLGRYKPLVYLIAATTTSLVIVKYNTIIHPFTLADNRHYIFYVFRYTILRHPSIRYLLVPIYLACGYFVYLTTCISTHLSPKQKDEVSCYVCQTGPGMKLVSARYKGPNVSFTLILLITTTLSLITSPLVEPRYFIIPWVLWRLHIPLNYSYDSVIYEKIKPTSSSSLNLAYKIRNHVAWLETFWFLLINLGTGYIFLYCGFEWPQERGKVQRFMW